MTPRVDPYKAVPEVQAILRSWDPIGVFSLPGSPAAYQDEYDAYAPAILSLLMRGAGVQEVTDHLERLRTREMGMPVDRDQDEAVANQLVSFWGQFSEPAA